MSSVMPLDPQVVSQTPTTVTIAWTPQPDCGYRFSVDGIVKSHTWNEAAKQARFAKPQDGLTHVYEIEPIVVGPGEKVMV